MEQQRDLSKVPRRGDGFDIGQAGEASVTNEGQGGSLVPYLDNPEQLMDVFNLDRKQAENVRSILVAAGTGAAHKYLANVIGGPLAGAVGGFLSGLVADKLTGRR